VSRTRAFVRSPIAALVLAASVALSASSPATAATPASRADQLISKITIDNFGRIDDVYYRGAQPHGGDYTDLATLGVKTVIDLTAQGEADVSEATAVERAGMQFFRIPLTTHDAPAAGAIEKFLGLVNDPANQPVYVHCQGGRHRTGVMTALYRMRQDSWDADRAYAEMQQYKFGPSFLHSTLKDFVYSYYSEHHGPAPAGPPAGATVASAR
jgi:tyrosine-protein phosphatase SIW14